MKCVMINSSLKIKWKEDFQLLPGLGYEASVPLPLAETWAGEQYSTLLSIYHNQDVSESVCTVHNQGIGLLPF